MVAAALQQCSRGTQQMQRSDRIHIHDSTMPPVSKSQNLFSCTKFTYHYQRNLRINICQKQTNYSPHCWHYVQLYTHISVVDAVTGTPQPELLKQAPLQVYPKYGTHRFSIQHQKLHVVIFHEIFQRFQHHRKRITNNFAI